MGQQKEVKGAKDKPASSQGGGYLRVGACMVALASVVLYLLMPWVLHWAAGNFPVILRRCSCHTKAAPPLQLQHPLVSSYSLSGEVPIAAWAGDDVGTVVAAARLPLVLHGSPADQWPARNWTFKYLQSHTKAVKPVYVHSDPMFMYEFETQPLGGKEDDGGDIDVGDKPRMEVLEKLPARKFFSKLLSAEAPFHSSIIPLVPSSLSAFRLVEHEVGPRHAFAPERSESENPNIWLTAANSVVGTHYDPGHNFHVIIHGEQQVTLWPPTCAAELYPYPHLHFRDRQAQVEEKVKFPVHDPAHLREQAYTTTLKPGAVLYIPPYWFYRLESLSNSIAVNIWSEAMEGTTAPRLLWRQAVPEPLRKKLELTDFKKKEIEGLRRDDEATDLQLALVQVFVPLLTSELLAATNRTQLNPLEFLLDGLLGQRYAPYLEKLPHCGQSFSKANCLARDDAAHPLQLSAEAIESMSEPLQTARMVFDTLAAIPRSPVDTIFFNFVERLSAHIVGVNEMCLFWQCLQHM